MFASLLRDFRRNGQHSGDICSLKLGSAMEYLSDSGTHKCRILVFANRRCWSQLVAFCCRDWWNYSNLNFGTWWRPLIPCGSSDCLRFRRGSGTKIRSEPLRGLYCGFHPPCVPSAQPMISCYLSFFMVYLASSNSNLVTKLSTYACGCGGEWPAWRKSLMDLHSGPKYFWRCCERTSPCCYDLNYSLTPFYPRSSSTTWVCPSF